jgi:GR25 family glycosyltransferase involved in LPS biosynthesis
VQDAVMRAPEAQLGQRRVRLTRKVAVGEEQKLDECDEVRIRPRRRRSARALINRRPMPAQELGSYVSHVDLFDPDC